MRKNYIDNLRIFCIFLLFPFHTSMIYNNWGEIFYITQPPKLLPSIFVSITYLWWMSLLFVMAGISTMYALSHRTIKEYMKERICKLFIPLLFAIVLVIPVQTYYADIFHNGYEGNYFEHYKEFFKVTDLYGGDGHFTPAHLWFILYLFIICIITLPLVSWYQKRDKKLNLSKFNMIYIVLLSVIVSLSSLILDIGGKSLGEFTCCFVLGYLIFSNDEIQNRIESHWKGLTAAWLTLMVIHASLGQWKDGIIDFFSITKQSADIIHTFVFRLYSWIGILCVLALGKKFLNKDTKFTRYFKGAIFPMFFFHQSVLVVVAFFVVKIDMIMPLQFITIMLLTFAITIILYEIFRRFRVTRFIFGIKKG